MNEQLKPFKTVEEIAKKHRLDVSFIEKQFKMGEKIEHEHTKNHTLAKEIALQHLDEIPDYYTRLKKMESDAKKHHKKFKDVKEATDGIKAKDYKGRLDRWFDDGGWVQTGGKYDGKPCAKQPGQTTKPYCRDPDDRAAMSKDERNKRAAKKRREDPNPNRSGEAKMVTQEAAGEKDACYKKVKSRYKVWPSAYASGALVKCRRVGADNWGIKSESAVDSTLNYEWDGPLMENPKRYCPKCKKVEERNECKFGQKYWDMFSLPSEIVSGKKDYSVTMPSIPESKEQKLVDKILDEMKCYPGYKKKGTQKLFGKKYNRCVKAEDVTIEDADGNTFAEVVDLIKPEPIKGFKSQIDEATRLQAQTGNVIAVTLSWKGKYYSMKMFFPQVKTPSRKEINDELQKVYPGSMVVYHSISEIQPGQPLIQVCGPQGGSYAKPGSNKNYIKPMGEEVEIGEEVRLDKSKMKCNKPKAQAVGDSLTGKSHVVKACEGGKEKIIRFGQRGVKGSPKKKGESKAYASRRERFKLRHAKNIARGKMSAAYWADKVKW